MKVNRLSTECMIILMRHSVKSHPDSLTLTLPLKNSMTLYNLINLSELLIKK